VEEDACFHYPNVSLDRYKENHFIQISDEALKLVDQICLFAQEGGAISALLIDYHKKQQEYHTLRVMLSFYDKHRDILITRSFPSCIHPVMSILLGMLTLMS
jgi:hypothetical protein